MTPQIVARWGIPVKEFTRVEKPGDYEPRHEKVYEGEWELTSTPRDPTPGEAYVILSEGVRRWRLEHPDDEITYLEISRGSPQRLKMQFIHHGHSPLVLIGILAAFVATLILTASVQTALTIALAIIVIWAVYRTLDYFTPKPVLKYACPECGAEFDTYGELKSHMTAEHPGVPIPSKEDVEKEIREFGLMDAVKLAALVGIGLVGAYAFFKYVLPAIRKPGE